MTPLLMLCIIWLAFHTDRRARMSRVSATALIISASIILGCVLVGLFHMISLLGKVGR